MIMAQLVGGCGRVGAVERRADGGADGLGPHGHGRVLGRREPKTAAGVEVGLLEDELVGGEGVGAASFAGDGDSSGDGADVLSFDLGDLVDAHAGVGSEDDLGAGVLVERECEDGIELGVGDWSGVAGWGLGSGNASGGIVGAVVGLDEPLAPGPQHRVVRALGGCAGEGGEPGTDGLWSQYCGVGAGGGGDLVDNADTFGDGALGQPLSLHGGLPCLDQECGGVTVTHNS